MGGKYKPVVNHNPPVGGYDIQAAEDYIRHKSPSATIRQDFIPKEARKQPEPTPEPYDAHLTPFGSGVKGGYDFGRKYEFKTNDVPPPGIYDPTDGENLTKSRTKSAIIRSP